MSYSITPENRVLKDGEDVGYILDGICYTNEPPKGRGIPSFRAMADNPELQFKPLPTGKDSLQVEPISAVQVVDTLRVVEPTPVSDDAGVGISFEEAIGFVALNPIMESEQERADPVIPEPPRSPVLGDRDPEWQRWFIATHGPDAFKAKWPNRKLP